MKRLCLLVSLLSAAAAQSIPLKGAPPMVPGSVGFSALDRDFYAVDGQDVFTVEGGALVRRGAGANSMKAWTKDRRYAAQPVPIGKNVYLQQGGKLYAFDRVTLKTLWTKNISGELLMGVRELPLLRQGSQLTRLNPANGAALWTIRRPDANHTPVGAELAGGVLLVHSSPAEGFQGEVYSAHDPQTGRRLWQANLGHGRLLRVTGSKAVFDLRDWDNLLGAGGRFPLAEVDLRTGKRRNFSRSFAALPPGPDRWTVDLASPLLDERNALWLVLRVRSGGGSRLARVDTAGRLRLWPLPAGGLPGVDNGEVRLFARGNALVVASPSGLAALRGERLSSLKLPLGGGLPTFTPLGPWLGVTAPKWGTVVFDEMGKVKYQVRGAGLPALSGADVLMPVDGRLTRFPVPREARRSLLTARRP